MPFLFATWSKNEGITKADLSIVHLMDLGKHGVSISEMDDSCKPMVDMKEGEPSYVLIEKRYGPPCGREYIAANLNSYQRQALAEAMPQIARVELAIQEHLLLPLQEDLEIDALYRLLELDDEVFHRFRIGWDLYKRHFRWPVHGVEIELDVYRVRCGDLVSQFAIPYRGMLVCHPTMEGLLGRATGNLLNDYGPHAAQICKLRFNLQPPPKILPDGLGRDFLLAPLQELRWGPFYRAWEEAKKAFYK